MNRSHNLIRLAAVALLATAGIAQASPAQAAALAVDVTCESLGHYAVLCERTITGGTGPYTTRWYYNGAYFASQDNKAFTSWSCSTTKSNQYKAVVVDALGASATDTSGVACRSGNP
ncbi:hypothetical protein QEZ54_20615 [Catellatospora sp. KI3]|uniref:hypothetical protein n=1 Tax=Catellatospora sp. KI3 TaxID=3041620 RepID=UPI002482148F|nr:hypothetical protein [Catellatospora sp. KI3]MDI1463387.1 hypothetical protein [Catellatospora sp. KI3]